MLCREESKPDSDLDEPWIMTVKGLHNFHNNMKAMEESVITNAASLAIQQQNGSNNNISGLGRESHLYKGGNQPRSPTSPNAPTSALIDNNFSTRKQQDLDTINTDINPGLVQLREKSYEREMVRSSSSSEESREKRSSKEVRI